MGRLGHCEKETGPRGADSGATGAAGRARPHPPCWVGKCWDALNCPREMCLRLHLGRIFMSYFEPN